MNTVSVPISEVKARLSEYFAKSAYSDCRIVITKRGRPVSALVGLDDLRELEQQAKRGGLAEVIGKWDDFDEIADGVGQAVESRQLYGRPECISLIRTSSPIS